MWVGVPARRRAACEAGGTRRAAEAVVVLSAVWCCVVVVVVVLEEEDVSRRVQAECSAWGCWEAAGVEFAERKPERRGEAKRGGRLAKRAFARKSGGRLDFARPT